MRIDSLFDGHNGASRVESWADDTKDWLLKTVHFFMADPHDAPAADTGTGSEVASAAGTGTEWQETGTGSKVTWLKNVVFCGDPHICCAHICWSGLIGLG